MVQYHFKSYSTKHTLTHTHSDAAVDESASESSGFEVWILLSAGHSDVPHALPGLVQLDVDGIHAGVMRSHRVTQASRDGVILQEKHRWNITPGLHACMRVCVCAHVWPQRSVGSASSALLTHSGYGSGAAACDSTCEETTRTHQHTTAADHHPDPPHQYLTRLFIYIILKRCFICNMSK